LRKLYVKRILRQLAFDKSIPPALDVHAKIAARTFRGDLSPLQMAATEIIPQGLSIALRIGEFVRQAYLYSAGIRRRSRLGPVTQHDSLVPLRCVRHYTPRLRHEFRDAGPPR
jgi:hypothetical protein